MTTHNRFRGCRVHFYAFFLTTFLQTSVCSPSFHPLTEGLGIPQYLQNTKIENVQCNDWRYST